MTCPIPWGPRRACGGDCFIDERQHFIVTQLGWKKIPKDLDLSQFGVGEILGVTPSINWLASVSAAAWTFCRLWQRQRVSSMSTRSSTSTRLISASAIRMTPRRNFSLARIASFMASVRVCFSELTRATSLLSRDVRIFLFRETPSSDDA